MATPVLPSQPVDEQLVTVKVLFDDSNRRFKLPLKDLRANVLPQKLRMLLGVPADVNVIWERYSDSAGSYIHLDDDNVAVYKQLYRAAKAKTKLRLKATTVDPSTLAPEVESIPAQPVDEYVPRHSYLETVLSSPVVPAPNPEPLPTFSAPASIAPDDAGISHLMRLRANNALLRDFDLEHDKLRFPVISHHSPRGMFCIDCNNCGRSIANEHYHCSICESGDYDLCPHCVTDGATCRGENHWLIKRVVQHGTVTNSTTETIAPRVPEVPKSTAAEPPSPQTVPVMETEATPRFTTSDADKQRKLASLADVAIQGEETLMCNGCCRAADESNVVRCNDCEDYDLCLRCLLRNKHGHHPGHTFQLGTDRNFCLKNLIMSRCLPGRQFKHAAICDGCDKRIVGTRHKCLTCPDWDFCGECHGKASVDHPGHRFVPIYDTLGNQPRVYQVHYGIFCDGPLCKDKPAQSYISGVRYKCAVCDDVDFCANCEAHPTLSHNHTHPLVKFKSPVRAVTVSTVSNDGSSGEVTLGDGASASESSTSTPMSIGGSTIDESPLEERPAVEAIPVEAKATQPEATQPAQIATPPGSETVVPINGGDTSSGYDAYFVCDTIADGSKLPLDTVFHQTWTLHNPGPCAWPVGSDVRFVGGDTMFNVDASHPSSVDSIRSAMESNKLTAPLAPGQSADFTVTLRTPRREGTAISYWRLKLPNGVPIGHRLWCDVQVEATSVEATPSSVVKTLEVESPADSITKSTDSGMVFPKLEKESPEASMHEAVIPVRPAPTVSSHAPTLSTASEGDILEDVESLALDEIDTDAGFLTDEEYDVLDASDQEFLEAKQSGH